MPQACGACGWLPLVSCLAYSTCGIMQSIVSRESEACKQHKTFLCTALKEHTAAAPPLTQDAILVNGVSLQHRQGRTALPQRAAARKQMNSAELV